MKFKLNLKYLYWKPVKGFFFKVEIENYDK